MGRFGAYGLMGQKKNNNPDTSGLIKWEKGVSGNPKGNSSAAWEVRRRNAEKIAAMQTLLADAMHKKAEELAAKDDPQELIDALVRTDITNLSREIMDRGFGKAQGSLDLTSSDGSAGPTTIRLVAAKDDDGTDD